MKERRQWRRFPIECPVSFQMLNGPAAGKTGRGVTVNMGSRGVLLATPHHVPKGVLLEVSVRWPAKLDNRNELKLVLSGWVVRSEEGKVAVGIRKHEFRVVGRRGLFVIGRRQASLPKTAVAGLVRFTWLDPASQIA